MAIAIVQTSSSSGFNIHLNGVTIGNTLVIASEVAGSSSGITSVTDSTGDIWVHPTGVLGTNSGGNSSDFWYTANAQPGTHTLTLTAGISPYNSTLAEFSGVDGTNPIYGGNHINNQNQISDVIGPNLTSTASGDWLLTGMLCNTGTPVATAPWSQVGFLSYYVPGSVGTYNATNTDFNACSSGLVLRANTAPIVVTNYTKSLNTGTMPVTAGDFVVVSIGNQDNPTSISDGLGNTYIKDAGGGSFGVTAIFHSQITNTGTAIVNWSGNTTSSYVSMVNLSGVNTNTPVRAAGTAGTNFPNQQARGPYLSASFTTDFCLNFLYTSYPVQTDPLTNFEYLPGAYYSQQPGGYYTGVIGNTYMVDSGGGNQYWDSNGIILQASGITYIQSAFHTESVNPTTCVTTLTGVTTSNLVVVAIGVTSLGTTNATIDISTVTDNLGNTYSPVSGSLSQFNYAAFGSQYKSTSDLWYCQNVTGGSLTATVVTNNVDTASYRFTVFIVEISGANLISPIESASNLSDITNTISARGPDQVSTTLGDFLLCTLEDENAVGGVAPWTVVNDGYSCSVGMYKPGPTGTYHMPTDGGIDVWTSSGVVLRESAGSVLTLSLSDSVSLSDSALPSFEIDTTVSDTVTVSDSAPNSFSVQSDFIAPVSTPVMEQLVIQLAPANVKLYFIIEE